MTDQTERDNLLPCPFCGGAAYENWHGAFIACDKCDVHASPNVWQARAALDGGAVSQDAQFMNDFRSWACKAAQLMDGFQHDAVWSDWDREVRKELSGLIIRAETLRAQPQGEQGEFLQCLICGAKHSGWSKADLEEWQKLVSPMRRQGRHPYGNEGATPQPQDERDLRLIRFTRDYVMEAYDEGVSYTWEQVLRAFKQKEAGK